MDTNVNYTLVGAFVIFLLTCMIMAIIWLSSGLSFQHDNYYLVYAEESVSGLSTDSPVEYNGVNVGKVKNITLSTQNPRLVEVLLNIKSSTPVTKGTVATLNSRGLTGVAYMALKDKGEDLSPITIEPGQSYPVIKSAPSFFLRLDAEFERLNRSISKVSNAMTLLLDEENLHSFKLLLINLRDITKAISGESGNLKTIINNTASASYQFPTMLRSGRGAMQSLESQTLPAATRAMTNLDDVSRNLIDVTDDLKQNPAIILRGVGPQPLGPGEK